MNEYEINKNTLAIIPVNPKKTKIIEVSSFGKVGASIIKSWKFSIFLL